MLNDSKQIRGGDFRVVLKEGTNIGEAESYPKVEVEKIDGELTIKVVGGSVHECQTGIAIVSEDGRPYGWSFDEVEKITSIEGDVVFWLREHADIPMTVVI